ncbi:hypothetical protein [Leisingera thetidis]|uniref:hypothetical protein n=1 Tax=Leisingera thetidis TaxID=2930199 RepID=UPI0021F7F252|nr:hypothetical protein [Leisingera thetidis]
MAGLPGHAPVRKVLRQASRDLRQIALENRDPAKPRAKLRTIDNTQKSNRPLIAVAPERQAIAAAQAFAVLEQAQTQLLRSAETSPTRSIVRYQRIAAAINSSKVLLRSA